MRRYSSAVSCLLAGLFATVAIGQSPNQSSAPEEPLKEVTVTAARVLDDKALSHAVSSFVESHSTSGNRINQIGRWYHDVCPLVSGLRPQGRTFVISEIVDMARAVGAPTRPMGKKCAGDIEIIFTREPQALLDHFAKSHRLMLGFYPKAQAAQMTTFSRPIQAWYETATRSENDHPGSVGGQISPMAQLDTDQTAMGWQPSGADDSLLGRGLVSEFAHVLIIADSNQIERYPMRAVADYIALLSLTRMSQLESCAPLSSITDLLASGCSAPVADSMTAADLAYLKGLYGVTLDKAINLERGDVHEQMMRQLKGQQIQ